MFKIFPSWKQFKGWSLISKYTAISLVVTVIALVISIVSMLTPELNNDVFDNTHPDYYNMGRDSMIKKDFFNAIYYFQKSLSFDSKNYPTYKCMAQSYYCLYVNEINYDMKKSYIKEIINNSNVYLSYDKNDHTILSVLSHLYKNEKDYHKSIKYSLDIIDIINDPNKQPLMYNFKNYEYKPTVIKTLEIKAEGGAILNLGECYMLLFDIDNSLKYFKLFKNEFVNKNIKLKEFEPYVDNIIFKLNMFANNYLNNNRVINIDLFESNNSNINSHFVEILKSIRSLSGEFEEDHKPITENTGNSFV